jgi:hypothetical protein
MSLNEPGRMRLSRTSLDASLLVGSTVLLTPDAEPHLDRTANSAGVQ